MVAACDTTAPADTRFGVNIFPAIHPLVMIGAFGGVHTRLIDGIGVVGHSDEHVISVGRIIANAAAFEAAVVGRLAPVVCSGTDAFILHYMVVARA